MSRPTNSTAPIDIDANPHAATYAAHSLRGLRGMYSRVDRASTAADAAALRGTRERAFSRFDRDAGWHFQPITAFAVDGIHRGASHLPGAFGPAEARADRRATARDCTRRAALLDSAAGRTMDETAMDAADRQAAYADLHRYRASQIARHDLIGAPAA